MSFIQKFVFLAFIRQRMFYKLPALLVILLRPKFATLNLITYFEIEPRQ